MALARRLIRTTIVLIAAGLWCGVLPRPSIAASATPADRSDHDPIEPFNRGVFEVNKALDKIVFKPLAWWYRLALPDPAQDSVRNFLANLLNWDFVAERHQAALG